MPEAPAIELTGISKRFGSGPPVLENVSLKAAPGEIVSIVGPSGCGKSTLLRIIAGLTGSNSGQINRSGPELNPAFIFQDATLLPWASVEDNIALPLRLKGLGQQERRQIAHEWASRVGLDHVTDYYPRQLSGGMRMRASIARAFSLSPNILLLDEPFGSLDAITRNRLNEVLLNLHGESRWTAFFVTHSVTEAVFLAHRTVIPSTHPGTVSSVIENPLPFPRDSRTRESLVFQQCVAQASAALNESLPDDAE